MSDQGGSSLLQADFTIDPLTPEQTHSARLTVAEHAHDAAEARLLLAMVGIEVGA